MSLQEQRRSLTPALHTSDQVWAPRRALIPRAFDARLAQHSLDELDGHMLLARRVGGVEADEVAGELDHERQCSHVSRAG